MTATLHAPPPTSGLRVEHRFRLSRAGVLNVWQYDDQEFTAADGRILLRGANGAGKSKTLEMLLPFVLDGDKARITASARHHTSLLWLMTDGYAGQSRIGYLWVEFARTTPQGEPEHYTCGIGIRASTTAKTATAWFFTTPRRVGHDLDLEDAAGPLTRPRLQEQLGEDGHVFESAKPYKEHVGRTLFGLEVEQYDDVLRLLYWLRQPQIGEDIEPARLTTQLAHALPQLDEHTVRSTGETFDSLAAIGEDLARRSAAAEGLARLADAYAAYARSAAAARGRAASSAHAAERSAVVTLRRETARRRRLDEELDAVEAERGKAAREQEEVHARREELRDSREARDQRRLTELDERARAAADTARRSELAAEQQGDRRQRVAAGVGRDAGRVADRLRALVGRVRELDDALGSVGAETPLALPAALDTPAPTAASGSPADALRLAEAVTALQPAVTEATAAARRRGEAVLLVLDIITTLGRAEDDARRAAERAARAEQRWEQSVTLRDSAQTDVLAAERDLAAAWQQWLGDPAALRVEGPVDLGPEAVAEAGDRARGAVAARLGVLREEEAGHRVAVRELSARLRDLQERYAVVERERDPSPPAPVLTRTDRPDGAPLWRLVDFADELADGERAAVEAALQDSGLLDAWVRPDGALLGPDHLDVVLAASTLGDRSAGADGDAGAPGRTLAALLRPDVPAGSDVAAEVVEALLTRVAAEAATGAEASTPHVSTDGSWSMGALRGRSAKDRAQFVGATARAEERRRRLAELSADISEAEAAHAEAARALTAAEADIAAVETWLAALPSDRAVRDARVTLSAREDSVARDAAVLSEAQGEASDRRARAAGIRDEVVRTAAQHGLAAERTSLEALRQRLAALDRELDRLTDALPSHQQDLRRLAEALTELAACAEAALAAQQAAERERDAAATAAARHTELVASVGADVQQLLGRIRELEERARAAGERVRALAQHRETLVAERARADRDVEAAAERRGEAQRLRLARVHDVGALAAVPGLLESAFGDDLPPGRAVLIRAEELPDDEDTPADVLDGVERLAALLPRTDATGPAAGGTSSHPPGETQGAPDPTGVWKAYTEASSGPAGDHEPAVNQHGALLAVAARDEAGDAPIAELARRVAAAVERDRDLLTEREKAQFERHVLGELGEAIRRCRRDADELVVAMNRLLTGVSTSQGIRVRLRWQLRDDVPAEAKESVRLLVQPLGALVPEERARLRDSLHRLIEASRAERPELSYSEHLAVALDYRQWFAFRIQYTRPESEGAWLELHRRSPLSQGEQKVLCYLPLFAAAAAHFTSLAGAAPHAPRLVLLDDAFPKIDVRTHPLLFGLLVDLDLDFVITSERLWGDHDTVPSLAIYEALRDPAERGIAQFEYRWDGRRLHAVG
ncbi:MAG TPA: TIGR02680 family protein [Dermatophilaceae bacterium]|nr:TIGR02680 family protein [Dermatophilaceae bacterium]